MLFIIVRRGDFRTYERLHQAFGDRAPVIWDRRRQPETPPGPNGQDRTAEDRRQSPPTSWVGLGFVVVDRAA